MPPVIETETAKAAAAFANDSTKVKYRSGKHFVLPPKKTNQPFSLVVKWTLRQTSRHKKVIRRSTYVCILSVIINQFVLVGGMTSEFCQRKKLKQNLVIKRKFSKLQINFIVKSYLIRYNDKYTNIK